MRAASEMLIFCFGTQAAIILNIKEKMQEKSRGRPGDIGTALFAH